jgi:small subunit ribosomal protein S1
VTVGEGAMKSFIKRSELSRDRSEQRPERFAKGNKIDAKVTAFDKGGRKIQLSIKAREIAEEKDAVAQYGSQDSGASLGDILGAVLARKAGKGEKPEGEEKPKKSKAKKAKDKDEGESADDGEEG